MSRAIVASTQVAVILSLDVITRTDSRTKINSPLWVNLTPILTWLLGLTEVIVSLVYLFQAVSMALSIYGMWAEILGKSLLFGLGVRT